MERCVWLLQLKELYQRGLTQQKVYHTSPILLKIIVAVMMMRMTVVLSEKLWENGARPRESIPPINHSHSCLAFLIHCHTQLSSSYGHHITQLIVNSHLIYQSAKLPQLLNEYIVILIPKRLISCHTTLSFSWQGGLRQERTKTKTLTTKKMTNYIYFCKNRLCCWVKFHPVVLVCQEEYQSLCRLSK